jgi:RNA polymerase sigma-70 factor (ECF subfamily)
MMYPTDDVELVRKAQQGDRDCLNRLAETARVRLQQYVFRMTLDEDLTQDIVQETILEMLTIFEKLQAGEKFWGWLQGIAFNKVRRHYGKQWRRKALRLQEAGRKSGNQGNDTLAEVVTDELKQIVLTSIGQLTPQHRAVLTLRCYDDLSYAEIADLVGGSEIGARATFYRAKKSLIRLLSNHGLGKGSLLLALIAFGKLTATSKAGAAQVAITGATLQVGPIGALLGAMTPKTGLVLATAAAVAVGSATVLPPTWHRALPGGAVPAAQLPESPWRSVSTQQQECWYHFPEAGRSPVMIRLLEPDPSRTGATCRILQNQYANYHYDDRADAVRIRNCRAWKPDLSVMGLPTDDVEMSRFIAAVQGRAADVELTRNRTSGLLVICRQEGDRPGQIWRIDRHLNVLDEEYFHFSWPETMRVIDERDAMHEQGWTYFRISGTAGDRTVSGTGRLPFAYASAQEHFPWLRIETGDGRTFVDTPRGAEIRDRAGRVLARCEGGSFFKGLPRPWMGLHCIDTVRRDAAESRLRFETVARNDGNAVNVTVYTDDRTLVYTVDMETDVIETIELFAGAPADSNRIGRLDFTYLQDLPEASHSQAALETRIGPRSTPAASQGNGLLWLTDLMPER